MSIEVSLASPTVASVKAAVNSNRPKPCPCEKGSRLPNREGGTQRMEQGERVVVGQADRLAQACAPVNSSL